VHYGGELLRLGGTLVRESRKETRRKSSAEVRPIGECGNPSWLRPRAGAWLIRVGQQGRDSRRQSPGVAEHDRADGQFRLPGAGGIRPGGVPGGPEAPGRGGGGGGDRQDGERGAGPPTRNGDDFSP